MWCSPRFRSNRVVAAPACSQPLVRWVRPWAWLHWARSCSPRSVTVSTAASKACSPDEQREGLVTAVTESAGGMIPKLLSDPNTQEIGQKAAEACTGAASTASYVAAAFLLVALLASSVLRARRLEDMDKEKAEPVEAE